MITCTGRAPVRFACSCTTFVCLTLWFCLCCSAVVCFGPAGECCLCAMSIVSATIASWIAPLSCSAIPLPLPSAHTALHSPPALHYLLHSAPIAFTALYAYATTAYTATPLP